VQVIIVVNNYSQVGMIKVLGLGPAGSAFASALGRAVYAVDLSPRYYKACGEAVPVDTPMVDRRYVLSKVRRFLFYLGDSPIGEVGYASPRWYIVDKGSWVSSLRERARIAGSGSGGEELVVDARGPYSSRGAKITVVRAYVRGWKRALDPEAVYFVYQRGAAGFYWVFPYGDMLNVGAGFLGVRNPVPALRSFIEGWLGGGSIADIRGAPLTVEPTVDLGSEGSYRVGEAAGLVYPLTGEGIRPGIQSALALVSALSTRRPMESYARAVSGIARQIEIQKRILRIAVRTIEGGGSISELVDDSVLRDYIEENISGKTFLAMISRKPLKALKLLSSILRR